MDNAQKAIMIGVGLFITIIVIAAIMMITGIGQDLINKSTGKLNGISNELEESMKSNYDQVTWTGSQVNQQLKKLTTEEYMAVYVITTRGATLEDFTLGAGDGTSKKPYSISKVGLTAKTIQANGAGEKMTSVVVTEASLEDATSDLSQVISTISSTNKYKSVLITDTTSGKTVGVVFVRYQ